MTYDKETRAEEMETELREDNIREKANEFDEGDYESWKDSNLDDLHNLFWENNKEELEEFCKAEWKEHNEGLN